MTEFKKKKQYGQNFLTNVAIPRRFAAESGITAEDGVIEIGPGFGILTKELSAIANNVVAIEIDTELMSILPEKLSDCNNVKIINEDILKIDINDLLTNEFLNRNVCGKAVPVYYVSLRGMGRIVFTLPDLVAVLLFAPVRRYGFFVYV